MRSCDKWLLTSAFVLATVGCWSQEVYRSSDSDVLARLSYDSAGTGSVCIAVSSAGSYRMVRSLGSLPIQRVQGSIPSEQFQQLRKSLFSTEFRALSGNHGGLIRQQAESFAADLSVPGWQRGKDKTQRLRWLNADGENPFPAAVAGVISWLKRFDPKDGKPFEYAEYQDVCPSMGFRLLQPSVATNSEP